MKGNFHVQFGIGGGESDLSADHTKNNAKELEQRVHIDQMVCDATRATQRAVYCGGCCSEWLATAFSAWPACRLFQKERVLCFSHVLSAFHRLLWLLLCLFKLPQRMEGSLTDLIRKRERVPAQQVDMIIAQG